MKAQNVQRESLPWKSPFQPFTAWFGFVGSTIITLVCGFSVFLKGNWSTADFFASYIGIPIFIVPIIVWKLVHKTKVSFVPVVCWHLADKIQFARAHTIDLFSGRLKEHEIVRASPKKTAFSWTYNWLT